MEKDVHQVMSAAIRTEYLVIDDVRETRYRKPIGCIARRKRPTNGISGQTESDMWVVLDVVPIIEVEKLKLADWRVNCTRSY